MPPTSRGLLLLRLIRRLPTPSARSSRRQYAVGKIPPNLSRPTPRPNVSNKTSTKDPGIQERAPNLPFQGPPGAPRVGKRLFDRFGPPFRYASRVLLTLMWWVPPIIFVGYHFPYQILSVEGPSMTPIFNSTYTSEAGILNTQDRVLIQKYRDTSNSRRSNRPKKSTGDLERGEIVVLRAPHNPEKIVVKRIVGLPGDRITPLPGYPDGTTSLIVPYNHLWLEGDIADRAKSVDSNWYGPVSKSLVIGSVRAILNFNPLPTWINWQSHTYPAQRRVERDAVAIYSAEEESRGSAFRDGSAQQALAELQRRPEKFASEARKPAGRAKIQQLYDDSVAEVRRQDPETLALATELAREFNKVLRGRTVMETRKNVSVTREEAERFMRGEMTPEEVARLGRDTAVPST